jgi:hypothetical protein
MTATHKHHRNFAQAQDEVNARGGMWKDGDMLEQLAAERDALSADLEAEKDRHAKTVQLGIQFAADAAMWKARAEAAEAEVARLRDALFECQEEIDAYIQHEYPHDHPVQERYRQRDYAANPARIALQEKEKDT